MLETLDYTIRIGSTPTFLYLDLYLYSAYAAHCVYLIYHTSICFHDTRLMRYIVHPEMSSYRAVLIPK